MQSSALKPVVAQADERRQEAPGTPLGVVRLRGVVVFFEGRVVFCEGGDC